MATLELDDTVYVVNKGDEPLTFRWDGREKTIEPGKRALVPGAAAVTALGDWRSMPAPFLGNVTRDPNSPQVQIPSRQQEIQRLGVRYYRDEFDKKGNENPDFGSEPEQVAKRMPRVEVYDGDENRLTLPLEDPDCLGASPEQMGVPDADYLKTELRKVMAKMKMLQARIGESEDTAPEAPEGVPVDGPPPMMAAAGPSRSHK